MGFQKTSANLKGRQNEMSEIFETQATSLAEFKHCVSNFAQYSVPSSVSIIDEQYLKTFYRGQSDAQYQCMPSVFRDGLISNEATIYQKSIEMFPYEFNHLDCHFDKLCKIQHYGAATRILDFTIRPEIALWFASDPKECVNGKVIIYRTTFTEQSDIGVKALAFLATYNGNIDETFYSRLRDDLGVNYSNEHLRQLIQKSYFVLPNITNERVYRQKGAFLIFGQKEDGEKTVSELDDNFGRGEEYPGYIGYITIPANCKASIRKELRKENFTRKFLLPNIESSLKKITRQCT